MQKHHTMQAIPELHFGASRTPDLRVPLLVSSPPLTTPSPEGALTDRFRWSWACRNVAPSPVLRLDRDPSCRPRVGDLVLVRVETLGYYRKVTVSQNNRHRLYEGDLFVGVFGNRYAADAYEGEVIDTDDLCILTGVGMVGTFKSKNQLVRDTTKVSFVGYVVDEAGKRLNLKELQFERNRPVAMPANLIIVVGTGMNSGKTTTAARLIKALSLQGMSVGACKLTGSVSNHDPDELMSAAAQCFVDFSDYGFPSTYLAEKDELLDLFHTLLAKLEKARTDVIIMEIADGLIQRETAMLLADPLIRQAARGVILSADSSLAALSGVERVQRLGYPLLAVSGKFTASPLAVKEYEAEGGTVPVASSAGPCKRLSRLVREALNAEAK